MEKELDSVYGILHKKHYKMLGVRIDEQKENRDIELDIDVGNIWTTESKDIAEKTIENPAAWFESSLERPRHQFKVEDLVVIELSNQKERDTKNLVMNGYVESWQMTTEQGARTIADLRIIVESMWNVTNPTGKISIYLEEK